MGLHQSPSIPFILGHKATYLRRWYSVLTWLTKQQCGKDSRPMVRQPLVSWYMHRTCIALVTAVTAIFALKHIPPRRADHKLSTATTWYILSWNGVVYCYFNRSDPTQNYNMEVLLREAVMTVMKTTMSMVMMTHENSRILYEIKLPTAEDTNF